MNELEEIPEVEINDVTPAVAEVADVLPVRKGKRKREAPKPAKKLGKKAQLVKRYLDNFDSSKQEPPTESEVKSMSVAKLETLCTLQEKQQTHAIQPGGLAASLIGFVSNVLDFLARTDGEITRLNEEDQELKRCVTEELGALATFLNNKVKIASHVALNSGRAIVKKRKLTPPVEKQTDAGRKEPTQSSSAKST